jgi:hypothetical protein
MLSKKLSTAAELQNFQKAETYLILSKSSICFESIINELINVINNKKNEKDFEENITNNNFEIIDKNNFNKNKNIKYDLLISDVKTLKLEDNFTGKKPKFFILFDSKYSIKTWKDFLVKIYEILYFKNPKLFESYADNANKLKNTKITKEKNNDFISPRIIANDYYTETNFDSQTIKKQIKNIFNHYSIDEEELIIVIE